MADFGNVIVRWDPRTLYSKIFPDPQARDRFLSEVCTLAWHAPTDGGLGMLCRVSQKQVVNVAQRGGLAALLIGYSPAELRAPVRATGAWASGPATSGLCTRCAPPCRCGFPG